MRLKPHKAADAVLEKLRFPAIVLPKIDGVRGCYLNSRFTARTLKLFRNTKLCDTLSNPLLQGFDGELVKGNPTDPGLCRRTTSFTNSYGHNAEAGFIDWYIFDYVTELTQNQPYEKRLALGTTHIQKLQEKGEFNFLKIIPHQMLCNSIEEVEEAHKQYSLAGFEGTVIRWANAPHKSGRSTVNQSWFMRLKDTGTEEAVIIDLVEAQTNANLAKINELGETERSTHQENKYGKGMVGALVVKIPDGRVIKIGAGCMTHEERIVCWKNPKDTIGRICTYRFMRYGEHEKRRQSRFVEFRDEDL